MLKYLVFKSEKLTLQILILSKIQSQKLIAP